MITSRGWLRAAIALVGFSAVLAPAAPASATAPTLTAQSSPELRRALPEPPPAEVARDELADLNVEAPHAMTGYSRAKFPHWARQYGECDTRVICMPGSGDSCEPGGSSIP
uniref:Uncharacterized protein n=1 Tax=Streptomyces sp. NBC_00003 TaxID=2903608 RepID=A0AAU2VFX5_9ACTN